MSINRNKLTYCWDRVCEVTGGERKSVKVDLGLLTELVDLADIGFSRKVEITNGIILQLESLEAEASK